MLNADTHSAPESAGELSEPLYFSSGEHQLFAWLHWTPGERRTDMGVVICQPFGQEAICAHRTVRAFASMVAMLGMPVLRFDYRCTGDSADGDATRDQIEPWVRDVVAASNELRRRMGVTRICLLGFRLGALLATLAAPGAAADTLLLIAPSLSGRRYLRELRTMALAGAGAANASQQDKRSLAPGALEAGGYLLSPGTVARLSELDGAAIDSAPAPQVLIIDRDDLPAAGAWSEALAERGVRTRYVTLPGFVKMMMTPPQFARVPHAMLQTARQWLLDCAGSITRPLSPAHAVADAKQLIISASTAEAPFPLHERPLSFGVAGMLFGILTTPSCEEPCRRAVILLNSGADLHIGAGRMHVTLARRWAQKGYLVLRMDLAGIGDSATRTGRADDEVFPPAAIEDLRVAVELLRAQYQVSEVTLAGLCSGAYHALQGAIAGLPVNRILMVNPNNLAWKEGTELGDLQLADVVREVGRERPVSLHNLGRLLRGQIDVATVSLIYLRRARISIEALAREAARWLGVRLPRDLGWQLRDLVERGITVVFIFARGEPGLELLRIQGGAALERLGSRFRVHIIDSADHTFTQSGARARLEDVLSDELPVPPAAASADISSRPRTAWRTSRDIPH